MSAPFFWQRRNIISWVLWPLSIVYYLLMKLDSMIKNSRKYTSTLPVISIGNITVGGSGKSPVTAFIAERLTKQGEKVAILSRGYGAELKGNKEVEVSNRPIDVSDEPLMLKKQLPKVQVWVGKDRTESARLAEQAGATCLLLDDGFQNWRMARDLDVVLVDAHQRIGNGFMLPAGCLREPVSALDRAGIIVSMNGELVEADISLNLVVNNRDVKALKGKKVMAFTGIGIPDKFFNSLKREGVSVVAEQDFADHHFFTEEEQKQLQQRAKKLGAVLVTTAKDATKLPEGFAHVMRVAVDGDVNKLMQKVSEVISEKRQAK